MNRQIRKVAGAVGVLMLALLVNLNFVQVVKGDDYRNNSGNQRVILDEYSNPRGAIVVDGTQVAESIATTDELKYLRRYPEGPIYAPATGFYSLLYGRTGIEDAENGVLSGTDDRLFAQRVADILTGRNPQGGSVDLTLNKAAQEAAYRDMAGKRGAVVALDPSTGAILTMVSMPSYDPNKLSSHDADAIETEWKQLTQHDPTNSLLNRALGQTYPPGSVFKIMVAAAALKAGIKPSDRIPAPDVLKLPGTQSATLQNFGGERCGDGKTDTLDHALTISCNTAFAQLCLTLGEQTIRNETNLFGLDQQQRPVPLAVAGSTIGPVIDQAALAQTCIGQRDVRVTPLQAAMLSAAVANQGVLMKPYLVKDERAHNLSVLSATQPSQQSTVIDPTLDQDLVTMMEHVVSQGTGTPAQITDLPGVVVAGKTGTADNGPVDANGNPTLAPHAWFSGFALQNGNAKIAVAVIIENGGVTGNETTGGKAAAPVARDVMEAYLRSVGVH